MPQRYSQKQIDFLLSEILLCSDFHYELTVYTKIRIYKEDMKNIVYGEYTPALNFGTQYHGTLELDYSQINFSKKLNLLNCLVNCIKIDRVPIYINTIPEVSKWRLMIGV